MPRANEGQPVLVTYATLLAWLENDLPDEEAELLNIHVADCDECREKLALMNAVQDAGKRQRSSTSPTQ